MMKQWTFGAAWAAMLCACSQQGGGAEANSATNNSVAAAPANMSVQTEDMNAAMPVEPVTQNLAAPASEVRAANEPEAPASSKARTRDAAPSPEKAAQRDRPAPQRNQTAPRATPKQEPATAPKPTCTPEHREMGHC